MHFIYISQLTPISYTVKLRQHSARPSCALIITVNILTKMVYRFLLCSDSDIS